MDDPSTQLDPNRMQGYLDQGIGLTMQYAPKVLLALLVLVVGMWIINGVVAGVGRALEFRAVEVTLARFLTSLSNVLLKALLLISVASMIGIETTSFVAIIGAGGLAVGLALQGSLANFAGGVLVLFFRPYKVGDFIEAQGVAGVVARIEIFTTMIRTVDNKLVIVPNGAISNGIITNYSAEDTRRVDLNFAISHGADIGAARATLQEAIQGDVRILANPAPEILVSALSESSVTMTTRTWVASGDYWAVYFDLNERAKIALGKAGVPGPVPQRVVHLVQA